MWLPCAEKSTVLNFQQVRVKVKALFEVGESFGTQITQMGARITQMNYALPR